MAKTSPGEFIRQVGAERKKISWPSQRETIITAVMVCIMTLLLGLFFLGVDAAFSKIVQALLAFLG